ARLSRGDGQGPGLLEASLEFSRRQAEGEPFPVHLAGAGGDPDLAENVERACWSRLQVRGTDDRLCLHAGDRHGQRPRRDVPSTRAARQARGTLMPARPKPAPSLPSPASGGGKIRRAELFRAWQRMLSGRRLDLLDPSPLDVEIEDIAHGLARVARWNGQT